MSDTQIVWNAVHSERIYDSEVWTADEFRELIASVEASAPAGSEVMVSVEMERGSYDESDQVTLSVGFNRPETAEETAARDERELQHLAWHRQRELADLARLQAKYGKDTQ